MIENTQGERHDDLEEGDLGALVRLIREECGLIADLLPAVDDAQWSPSPVPRPREDTDERSKGGHSDPTPTLALDRNRLALRAQVLRSERLIREAAVSVLGVHRGLQRTLDAWEGVK